MNNLFLIFIALSIFNVILSTARSIITIKCGKTLSSIANAIYFGFYTIVLIYMSCDLTLWEKVAITAICNLIGVYIVKLIEEKMRKDKLWKIEATIYSADKDNVVTMLENAHIPFNYIDNVGVYTIVNIYCSTQKQSSAVKEILKNYRAKYFVSESKIL